MLNWWAVLVGAFFNIVFGFLWYGPIFGRAWRSVTKRQADPDLSPGLTAYIVVILGAVVSAVVLATVISFLRVYTWWSGMMWGAALSFGFAGTAILTHGTFEGLRLRLSVLYIGYMVIAYAAQGALFAVWR
ncbi:MAG: DUF1761 domain-containing protein [Spirochaeta sp.]|jgi:hypothetical protein|nr:DUF1761 domain-containing protein [Spirochaeta sp.]